MTEQRYGSNVDLKLLTRKGVFPYEYLDSMDVLDASQLPPREAFSTKLHGSECSTLDYAHAQTVWKAFRCQSMRDYLELYLFTDICLLADVSQTFRATS